MTYTREYSFRKAFDEHYDLLGVRRSIEKLVGYVSEIHKSGYKPIKFKISRVPSIRYPRFNVEVLVNGVDNSYKRDNIDRFLDKETLVKDPFMYSFCGISGIMENNNDVTSMVICTSSEIDSYKCIFNVNENSSAYPIKANVYDEVSLKVEYGYNLKYIIEIGADATMVGTKLRRELVNSEGDYIYELTDSRKDDELNLHKEVFD
jgi:hypothetical protein